MYDQYRSDAQNGNPWTKYTVLDLIDKKYIDPPMDGNHGELHPKASDYVAIGIPLGSLICLNAPLLQKSKQKHLGKDLPDRMMFC